MNETMFAIVVVLVIFICVSPMIIAASYNRSVLAALLLSILFTPFVALIVLLLMGKKEPTHVTYIQRM